MDSDSDTSSENNLSIDQSQAALIIQLNRGIYYWRKAEINWEYDAGSESLTFTVDSEEHQYISDFSGNEFQGLNISDLLLDALHNTTSIKDSDEIEDAMSRQSLGDTSSTIVSSLFDLSEEDFNKDCMMRSASEFSDSIDEEPTLDEIEQMNGLDHVVEERDTCGTEITSEQQILCDRKTEYKNEYEISALEVYAADSSTYSSDDLQSSETANEPRQFIRDLKTKNSNVIVLKPVTGNSKSSRTRASHPHFRDYRSFADENSRQIVSCSSVHIGYASALISDIREASYSNQYTLDSTSPNNYKCTNQIGQQEELQNPEDCQLKNDKIRCSVQYIDESSVEHTAKFHQSSDIDLIIISILGIGPKVLLMALLLAYAASKLHIIVSGYSLQRHHFPDFNLLYYATLFCNTAEALNSANFRYLTNTRLKNELLFRISCDLGYEAYMIARALIWISSYVPLDIQE